MKTKAPERPIEGICRRLAEKMRHYQPGDPIFHERIAEAFDEAADTIKEWRIRWRVAMDRSSELFAENQELRASESLND